MNLADRMELLLQRGFSFPPAFLAAVAGLVLLVLLLGGGLINLTGALNRGFTDAQSLALTQFLCCGSLPVASRP